MYASKIVQKKTALVVSNKKNQTRISKWVKIIMSFFPRVVGRDVHLGRHRSCKQKTKKKTKISSDKGKSYFLHWNRTSLVSFFPGLRKREKHLPFTQSRKETSLLRIIHWGYYGVHNIPVEDHPYEKKPFTLSPRRNCPHHMLH